MYKYYVLPVFYCGDIIWGMQSKNESMYMNILERFGERFLKKISKGDAAVNFESFNLMSIVKPRLFHYCLYVFKCRQNMIPSIDLLPIVQVTVLLIA